MDKKDILKSVYEDFFGIDVLAKRNEKLALDIENLKPGFRDSMEDIPEIVLGDETSDQESDKASNTDEAWSVESGNVGSVEYNEKTEKDKDEKMKEFFEKIENLYVEDSSKEALKKIIEYMRKYDEKIEKQYISFNMSIYTNNKETIIYVTNLLNDAANYFNYIRSGKAIEVSMYDVEEANQIGQAYENKNNFVVLKDFEGLNSKEQNFKNRFFHEFSEAISKNSVGTLTILTAKNKEIINQALNDELKEEFFDFEIVGTEPDVQDAYQDVLNKVELDDEEFEVKLLDYISTTYPNNTLPYPDYRDKLCEKILFNKEVPSYEREKTLEEIFAELNNLVGLDKVKQMLNDLVNLIELKNKSGEDLKIKNVNLHMCFLGNPGTGKTTVARIVAEMLYNLKYVKQNKLIEASSKDLVAEYVGQTAPKTMAVIEKARGGVLFIDEAYSLASGQGQGNSFNEEAIATLIQAMENYRDDLVVIFAGYTREMQDFLNANSGIVSRIGYTVEFEDYTPDELIKIFEQMMTKSGFLVTEPAINKVRELINEYKDTKNFGNARFVRNIYEKSIVKHASNTKGKKSKKILKTIEEKDISAENLLKM